MSNYGGIARSNYFQVKDEEAFRSDMERLELTVVNNHDDKGFALLADGHEAGWPTSVYDEEADEDLDVDIADEVAKHLADGQVAVLMEVGHEKLRYVNGFACAVNSSGETRRVSLDDIFDRAKEIAGEGVEVTDAAY